MVHDVCDGKIIVGVKFLHGFSSGVVDDDCDLQISNQRKLMSLLNEVLLALALYIHEFLSLVPQILEIAVGLAVRNNKK